MKLDALRADVESLVEMMPGCSGNWIGGSGGHRKHEPCNRAATWFDENDRFAYCDGHILERDKQHYDLPLWIDEYRTLLKRVGH